MSSILDALKKADREAAADRNKNTPWSSFIPSQKSNRIPRMWLWISIVFGIGLFIAGFLFFNTWNTKTSHNEATGKTEPVSHQGRDGLPPQTTPPPTPVLPLPETSQEVVIDNIAKQAEPSLQAETLQTEPPIKKTAPLGTDPNPPQTANELSSTSTWPPPSGSTSETIQKPVSDPNLSIEAPRTPPPTLNPTITKTQPDRKGGPPPAEKKNYKNDQRIELQALVWAPEPADRFVVINNQLIREGGSVDNIVVEKINPDDVRLAEGNDHWYHVFKVR